MAGYKTHITCSTIAGVALAFFAHTQGVSIPLAVFGGTICSLGGIVPDIDSKTSTSFRLCLALISGFSALLLVSRLGDFELDSETIVIIGSIVFILCWSVFGTLVKRFTRHRGMCHSLPMAFITAEIIFLLTSGDTEQRLFKSFAVFLGVMVHLLLDEFYSINSSEKVVAGKGTLKKSFGTALKMIDFQNMKSTIFVYIIFALLTNAVINEPVWSKQLGDKENTPLQERAAMSIKRLKSLYPMQYDISVIEWAAENQLLIEPASADNDKWKELEILFNSQNQSKENKTNISDNKNPTGNKGDSRQNTGENKPSFLERLNWSIRQNAQKKKDL